MLLSLLLISLFLFIFNASHYVQCEHQTKSLGAVMKTRFMCTPAYYVFFIYKILYFQFSWEYIELLDFQFSFKF